MLASVDVDLLDELRQLHDRKNRYLPGWNMDSI